MGQSVSRKKIQEFNPGDCQLLSGIEIRYFDSKKNKWYRTSESDYSIFNTNLKFMEWLINVFNIKGKNFNLYYLDYTEQDIDCPIDDLIWKSINLYQKFNPDISTYLIANKEAYPKKVQLIFSVRYTPK